MGQFVPLYQTGIVGHLPAPPGQQLFDADRVDILAEIQRLQPLGKGYALDIDVTCWKM